MLNLKPAMSSETTKSWNRVPVWGKAESYAAYMQRLMIVEDAHDKCWSSALIKDFDKLMPSSHRDAMVLSASATQGAAEKNMLLSWKQNKKATMALSAATAEDPRIQAVISAAKTLAWPQELAWKVKSRLDKKYLPSEDNKEVEVIKELQEL